MPVLRDVSFSIEPGQVVGIVGPTGSGKSTVLSLLPRFYDPAEGRVLIDGIDIADYKLAALRDQIGFVLQDAVLFRGTVRENISRFGAWKTSPGISSTAFFLRCSCGAWDLSAVRDGFLPSRFFCCIRCRCPASPGFINAAR